MLSSDPISPFMEGSGNARDDGEGGGILILFSAGASLLTRPSLGVTTALGEGKLIWLVNGRFLGA